MSDTGSLQVVAFPFDENDPHMRNQHIEIHRVGGYVEVRQGNKILGSLELEKKSSDYYLEEGKVKANFTYKPMVIIHICNGAQFKDDK